MSGTPIQIVMQFIGDAKNFTGVADQVKKKLEQVNKELLQNVQAAKASTAATAAHTRAIDDESKAHKKAQKARHDAYVTQKKLAQQEVFLANAWKNGSHVIDKKYLNSLRGLSTAYKRFNSEAKHSIVVHKGLLTTLDDPRLFGPRFIMKANLATRTFSNMAGAIINMGKNAQWTGRQMMVGITVPIAAIGGLSVKSAMEVAELDLQLKRLTKGGTASLAALDAQSKELSTTFGIARTEVKQIQAIFAQVGLPNIDQLTKATVAFASLGDVDTTQASELVRVLRQSGIEGKELEGTLARLDEISDSTSLSLPELTSALPKVAVYTKQLGVSVERTAALLAGFTQHGIDADEAAVSLKSSLARLVPALAAVDNPNDKDGGRRLKALKEAILTIRSLTGLNISFRNESGQVRDAAEMFQQLAMGIDRLKKAGNDEAIQGIFRDVFGAHQIGRGAAFIDSLTKSMDAASAGGQDLAKAMQIADKSTNAALERWQSQLAIFLNDPSIEFKNQINEMVNSAQDLGKKLIPVATDIMAMINKVIGVFNNMDESTKNRILAVVGAFALLGPVVYIAGQSMIAMGTIAKAMIAPFASIFKMRGDFKSLEDGFDDVGESLFNLREDFKNHNITREDYLSQTERLLQENALLAQSHDRIAASNVRQATSADAATAAMKRQNAATLAGQAKVDGVASVTNSVLSGRQLPDPSSMTLDELVRAYPAEAAARGVEGEDALIRKLIAEEKAKISSTRKVVKSQVERQRPADLMFDLRRQFTDAGQTRRKMTKAWMHTQAAAVAHDAVFREQTPVQATVAANRVRLQKLEEIAMQAAKFEDNFGVPVPTTNPQEFESLIDRLIQRDGKGLVKGSEGDVLMQMAKKLRSNPDSMVASQIREQVTIHMQSIISQIRADAKLTPDELEKIASKIEEADADMANELRRRGSMLKPPTGKASAAKYLREQVLSGKNIEDIIMPNRSGLNGNDALHAFVDDFVQLRNMASNGIEPPLTAGTVQALEDAASTGPDLEKINQRTDQFEDKFDEVKRFIKDRADEFEARTEQGKKLREQFDSVEDYIKKTAKPEGWGVFGASMLAQRQGLFGEMRKGKKAEISNLSAYMSTIYSTINDQADQIVDTSRFMLGDDNERMVLMIEDIIQKRKLDVDKAADEIAQVLKQGLMPLESQIKAFQDAVAKLDKSKEQVGKIFGRLGLGDEMQRAFGPTLGRVETDFSSFDLSSDAAGGLERPGKHVDSQVDRERHLALTKTLSRKLNLSSDSNNAPRTLDLLQERSKELLRSIKIKTYERKNFYDTLVKMSKAGDMEGLMTYLSRGVNTDFGNLITKAVWGGLRQEDIKTGLQELFGDSFDDSLLNTFNRIALDATDRAGGTTIDKMAFLPQISRDAIDNAVAIETGVGTGAVNEQARKQSGGHSAIKSWMLELQDALAGDAKTEAEVLYEQMDKFDEIRQNSLDVVEKRFQEERFDSSIYHRYKAAIYQKHRERMQELNDRLDEIVASGAATPRRRSKASRVAVIDAIDEQINSLRADQETEIRELKRLSGKKRRIYKKKLSELQAQRKQAFDDEKRLMKELEPIYDDVYHVVDYDGTSSLQGQAPTIGKKARMRATIRKPAAVEAAKKSVLFQIMDTMSEDELARRRVASRMEADIKRHRKRMLVDAILMGRSLAEMSDEEFMDRVRAHEEDARAGRAPSRMSKAQAAVRSRQQMASILAQMTGGSADDIELDSLSGSARRNRERELGRATRGSQLRRGAKGAASVLGSKAASRGVSTGKSVLNAATYLHPAKAATTLGKSVGKLAGVFGILSRTGGTAGQMLGGMFGPGVAQGASTVLGVALPLLPIIAAIGGAIFLVWKNWDKVSKGIGTGVERLKTAFVKIKDAALGPFIAMFDRLSGKSDGAGKGMEDMWKRVGVIIDRLSGWIANALNLIAPVIQGISSFMAASIEAVVLLIQSIVSFLTGNWKDGFSQLGKMFLTFINWWRQTFATAIGWIAEQILKLPVYFFRAIDGMLDGMQKLIKKIPGLGGILSKTFGVVTGSVARDGIDSVVSWYEDRVDGVGEAIADAIRPDNNAWKPAKDDAKEAKDEIEQGLGEPVVVPVEPVVDEGAAEEAKNDIDSFINALKSRLSELTEGWKNAAMDAFDKWSDAQVQAIDDKISAIDKEIEAERKRDEDLDYLVKKDELRNKRRQAAIQYITDRDLAVYEGRYDDARQLDYDYSIQRSGFDQEEKETERDRQRVLSDRVREGNRERLEIERDAMRDSLEIRKEQLQAELDMLTRYIPRNVAEAERMHQAIQAKMSEFTAGYGTIAAAQAAAWNSNWSTAIQAAKTDLAHEAFWAGEETIKEFARALGIDMALVTGATPPPASSPGSQYSYADAQQAMNHGSGALAGNVRSPQGGRSGTTSDLVIRHSGGPIGSTNMSPDDVPATLQTGEYVVQRKAVSRLGLGALDKINQGHIPVFHTGGLVGAFREKFAGAVDAFKAGRTKLAGFSADDVKNSLVQRFGGAGTPEELAAGIFHRNGEGSVGGSGYTDAMMQAKNYILNMFGDMQVGGYGKRPIPSDHTSWRAWDFMVGGDRAKGDGIANALLRKANEFGIKYLIWYNRITSGNGWKPYRHKLDPQGLNDTLSHRDHVHASFYDKVNALNVAAGTAGSNIKDTVRGMLGGFGWGDDQWGPTNTLVQGESSWNPRAANNSSSARGLFQFLKSTWGQYITNRGGPAYWNDDATWQAKGGLSYIKERYGSPAAALAAWQSRSPHWYHNGGLVFPQLNTGGTVLREGLAKIHAKETVLTAPLSAELEAGIKKINAGGTGEQVHLHFDGGFFGGDAEIKKLATKIKEVLDARDRAKGLKSRSYS